MRKDNKNVQLEISKISKNAEEIIREPYYRGYKAVYEELIAEIENIKTRNKQKQIRIGKNEEMNYKYEQ